MHGGAALPQAVPVRAALAPSGGDDTAAIQAALNKVGALPPGADGLRGRVLLGPGTFLVSAPLVMNASGVVLEGSASHGPNTTALQVQGAPFTLFQIGGAQYVVANRNYSLAPGYVPSGASTIALDAAEGLAPGDDVLLNILHNGDWMRLMWAGGTYPPVYNGTVLKAWGATLVARVIRRVAAVSGSQVTPDAPSNPRQTPENNFDEIELFDAKTARSRRTRRATLDRHPRTILTRLDCLTPKQPGQAGRAEQP
jgi:hypothetical protein